MPQKLLEYAKKNYIHINENDIDYKEYGGMNGLKFQWVFNDSAYMIKSQEKNNKPKKRIDNSTATSLNNSIISEYVGSQVINAINFKNIIAQNTMLVYHPFENKCYVACEHVDDFRWRPTHSFISFAGHHKVNFGNKYRNEEVSREKDNISIKKMIDWINNVQTNIDKDIFIDYFYNMFVIDTFLLNWDRNPTNWGFIVDNKTKQFYFAPLIDQGGSLLAKQDFKDFELINDLKNDRDVDMIFQKTKSFFKYDESKGTINYAHFLSTTTNVDLLLVYNDFINHMKNINIQEIVDSLSIPQEYKQTYTKLLERSLFNINKFAKLNPLYKEILKEQENKQEQKEEKKIKKETKSSLSR